MKQILIVSFLSFITVARADITFSSLLQEMTDRDSIARFPDPAYECLQASSYSRLSTARDQADQSMGGWFANQDYEGFIRSEVINGQKEWVVMEHSGPGALTRFWAPFFFFDLNDRVGPQIRVYLDGATTPVIDENFIELLTNLDWQTEIDGIKPPSQNSFSIPAPFANYTRRAGVLHLPIPFSKSCKVTFTSSRVFYHTITYRTYPEGTDVKTFTKADLDSPKLIESGEALTSATNFAGGALQENSGPVGANDKVSLNLPAGAGAVRHIEINLDVAAIQRDPSILRSLVLSATFDGEETIWCPVGNFFCSSASLNNLSTWTREVVANEGKFVCRWVMPYETSGTITLTNLGRSEVDATLKVRTAPWQWDARSMHFHSNWRADYISPAVPTVDWNFIDIRGKGVFVGDSWTVLNLTDGWWGEGDEKIYIDDEYEDDKFPSHFGTGTEDYYGWAGGIDPVPTDTFSAPFEANVQVGSRGVPSSRGFNISTRNRSLDAIPFSKRFVFDMESLAGHKQRNAWNLLMYTAVTHWYALPGATSNRPPLPAAAAQPITSFDELLAQSELIKSGRGLIVPGAIEGENQLPSAASPGVTAVADIPPAAQNPGLVLSNGRHLKLPFTAAGQFVEFRLTQQFTRQMIRLRLSTFADYGKVDVTVNGTKRGTALDLVSASLGVKELELGEFDPVDSSFTIRITSAGAGSGGGFTAAVDAFALSAP